LGQNEVDYYMEKEVAAALESVIPRAALGPFVTLNPSEKVPFFILGYLIGRISKFGHWNQTFQQRNWKRRSFFESHHQFNKS